MSSRKTPVSSKGKPSRAQVLSVMFDEADETGEVSPELCARVVAFMHEHPELALRLHIAGPWTRFQWVERRRYQIGGRGDPIGGYYPQAQGWAWWVGGDELNRSSYLDPRVETEQDAQAAVDAALQARGWALCSNLNRPGEQGTNPGDFRDERQEER